MQHRRSSNDALSNILPFTMTPDVLAPALKITIQTHHMHAGSNRSSEWKTWNSKNMVTSEVFFKIKLIYILILWCYEYTFW